MRRKPIVHLLIALALGALITACASTSRSDDDAADDIAAEPTATEVAETTDDTSVEPDDADDASSEAADDHDHSDDAHADDHDHDHADDGDDHDHAHNDDEADDDSGSVEVDEPAYRLLISDGEQGEITVLDTASGEVASTFEVDQPDGAPNRFATTEDGRYGFVVMYGQDGVVLIDGGVWEDDHGDHAHYYVAPPEHLADYPGGQPAHVVSHAGTTAIFYDADGTYLLLDEDAISEGGEGQLIEVDAPHHGVAIPWDDDRTIVSLFGDLDPEETTLPDEVVIHNRDGEIIEDGFPECAGLHGEVVVGHHAAFACADSILVLEEHGDHFHAHSIAYPDDENRSGTLRSASGLDVIIGNYSEDTFLVIDPAELTIELIEIPEPFSAFAVFSYDGGTLLGMTASGNLHAIEISTGEAQTIEQVTDATDDDADWTDPAPQIAVGPNRLVYISDPATGSVHEVDLTSADVTQTFELTGTPFHLAVIGNN